MSYQRIVASGNYTLYNISVHQLELSKFRKDVELWFSKMKALLNSPEFQTKFTHMNSFNLNQAIALLNLHSTVIAGLIAELFKDELGKIKELEETQANVIEELAWFERVLTPGQVTTVKRYKNIQSLFDRGWPMGEIAKEVGMTRQGVIKVIRRLGLTRPSDPLTLRKFHSRGYSEV